MGTDAGAIEIVAKGDGCVLCVKVVPGAARTRIAGVLGSALKIAVSAAPEGGKANAAVRAVLAAALEVRGADVELVGGATRPQKRFAVRGVSPETARARLTRAMPQ